MRRKKRNYGKIITRVLWVVLLVVVVVRIIQSTFTLDLPLWVILFWVLGLPAVLILITEVLKAMPTVWAAVKAWVGKFLKGPDGK